ncbi:MAG TPA: CARDB domain-containing protein [archaeon]|nr:CARDB domain-containing protein [archaeon]
MKKRMVFAALMAVLIMLPAAAVQAQEVQNTAIFNVILTNQNPYPAEPSKNVNVEVEVQNTGLGDATNIVVEIVPSAPFRLLPGSESTKTYTRISASSSVKASYDLKIDEDAISNPYELEFRIYPLSNPTSYLSKKVAVNVQGQPDFIIDSTWTVPQDIEPGGRVKVYARLKNVGTGTANQVQASLNSSSGVLIPVLSSGSVYLGDIVPQQESVAEIELAVDSTAEQKTYPSTLTVSYKDETGTSIQETFSLGIPVTGVISLDIINVEANFDRNVLQIEIANKGTADANSLEARLLVNGNSLGVDYISQLKATKKATLEFPLVTEGQGRLVLNYTTPDLRQGHVEKDISVRYENPNQGSPISTLILVAIVAVIAYVIWRRFFRKKKKKFG